MRGSLVGARAWKRVPPNVKDASGGGGAPLATAARLSSGSTRGSRSVDGRRRTVASSSPAVATKTASYSPRAPTETLTYVDTHCHLDLIFGKMDGVSYETWRSEVEATEATEEGFLGATMEACISIACSNKAFGSVKGLLGKPGVMAAFGCHPLSAAEWNDDMAAQVRDLVSNNPAVVAVGECGLDYYYPRLAAKEARQAEMKAKGEEATGSEVVRDDDTFGVPKAVRELQAEAFVAQMKLATELGAALIVHTREAEEDTFRLMCEHLPRDAKVHVHCFTSSLALATRLLDAFPNLCIGFTGVVTFKNAPEVRQVVDAVSLDRILLETDGPYMAPVPHRGSPAHPGHVPYIAAKIAEVKGVAVEDVFRAARENTRRVYGF